MGHRPTTSTIPSPTATRRSTIRLLGVDVPLYTSLGRQYNELRRELRLLSLSHQSDYPLAGDLTSMFANFERQFPDTSTSRSGPRRRRAGPGSTSASRWCGRPAPVFVTMTEMFDVADAFCRAERLLSLARTALPARVPQLAARRADPPARGGDRPSRGTAAPARRSSSTSQVG